MRVILKKYEPDPVSIRTSFYVAGLAALLTASAHAPTMTDDPEFIISHTTIETFDKPFSQSPTSRTLVNGLIEKCAQSVSILVGKERIPMENGRFFHATCIRSIGPTTLGDYDNVVCARSGNITTCTPTDDKMEPIENIWKKLNIEVRIRAKQKLEPETPVSQTESTQRLPTIEL